MILKGRSAALPAHSHRSPYVFLALQKAASQRTHAWVLMAMDPSTVGFEGTPRAIQLGRDDTPLPHLSRTPPQPPLSQTLALLLAPLDEWQHSPHFAMGPCSCSQTLFARRTLPGPEGLQQGAPQGQPSSWEHLALALGSSSGRGLAGPWRTPLEPAPLAGTSCMAEEAWT